MSIALIAVSLLVDPRQIVPDADQMSMPGLVEDVEYLLVGDFGGAQQCTRFAARVDGALREGQAAEQQVVGKAIVESGLPRAARQLNFRICDSPHLAKIARMQRPNHARRHRDAGAL